MQEIDNNKQAVCPVCGKGFVKSNVNHKFCSAECRKINEVSSYHNSDTYKARFTIFQRDDFKCVYCGKSSIEHGAVLVIDHIRPYISSKSNSIYNLVTSCSECNLEKASNQLSHGIYCRIVHRNIERNKGITQEEKDFVDQTLDEYFKKQKSKMRYSCG
jgi:5-methylcytosine-specific restriction endonuclease McrA